MQLEQRAPDPLTDHMADGPGQMALALSPRLNKRAGCSHLAQPARPGLSRSCLQRRHDPRRRNSGVAVVIAIALIFVQYNPRRRPGQRWRLLQHFSWASFRRALPYMRRWRMHKTISALTTFS